MPLSPGALKKAEALEERLRSRIENDPDLPDYDAVSARLSRVGSLIDETYNSQRQVDDTGKLTEDAPTRQPARVGEGDSDYFFEPNVREVQAFFNRNPDALDRLRDSHGQPLRPWAEGVAQEEIRSPMFDPQTQAVIGYNVTPGKTHLDQLTENDEPYKVAAEEMWRLASEEATKKGKAVKRYRDVKLDKREWKDYVEGGVKKGYDRVFKPAVLGAADAMTAGVASSAYDELLKRGRERQANMTPEEQASAREMGFDPQDTEGMGTSEDIQNRSMPAYVAGNVAGYGVGFNPANIAQRVIQEGLEHTVKSTVPRVAAADVTRDVVNRAGIAAVAGGVTNAAESAVGDVGRAVVEGRPVDVGNVASNAAVAGALGVTAGGIFDLAGQGIGAARDSYRNAGRNAPLRTHEQAGGEASIWMGVSPTKEINEGYARQAQDRLDEKVAPRTVAGQMSEDLAPQIDQSVRERALAEQERIGKEMQEYYAHPAYRDRTVSAAPAVQGLIEMASRGIARGPVDGSMMPMNPEAVNEIGSILGEIAQAGPPIARADAPALAHASGGVVVDGELANRLYGFQPDDPNYYRPGTDAVIRPVKINAEKLTILEDRIDGILKYANTPGGADEPVWKEFNARVKAMRDEFPLYRDADGRLVEPPPPEPEPFAPADDIPRGPSEGRYLAPPLPVHGPTPPKPEGVMGVGPGGPPLPKDPFDPRAPKRQGSPAEQLPRPIGVGGEGMVARPEGLYGVGPGGPPVPENPFDARLPTSRESINPQRTVGVQGEYGPPPPLDPNARVGVGERFNPELAIAFTPEGLPMPGGRVAPQPTQSVQGSYNRPPEVEMEPAPATNRNPYGFADRGQPPHETPLPPSGRNPMAPNKVSEESLQEMSLKAPMERSDELAAAGMDEGMHQREYGNTPPIEAPTVARGDLAGAIKASTSVNGLAMVSDVVKAYGGDVKAAHAAILDAYERGAIELRPEGGLNRLSPEEKAMAIPGPQGTVLSGIRVLDEGAIAKTPTERIRPREDQDISPEERAMQQHEIDEFLRKDREMNAPKPQASAEGEFTILDKRDNTVREQTFATKEEAAAEAKRLGTKFKAEGRFRVKKAAAPAATKQSRSPLERQLDAQLDAPDAPPVPKTEIEEAGARQTADREQVAANQKAYLEDILAPGREARAAQIEQIRALGENPEVIEEAIEAVKEVDRRLGPISQEQKRAMVIGIIEKKLGRKIDAEDLIRFGLISAGLVELGTGDDDTSAVGAGLFSFGLGGKGKKGSGPDAPKGPTKPTQPEAKLDDGRVVRGFSAMRHQQHDRQTAIEKAMKRLGVEGDVTLENRIRTYGQLADRGTKDQALLDEASNIGKQRELRSAAGANAYEELKDRRFAFFGNEGIAKGLLDFFGFRLYAGSEYLAGRYQRNAPPGKDRMYRNPYIRDPDTLLGEMQRSLVEDPARRLLNLTGGGPAARAAGNELREQFESDSYYESEEEYQKKKREKRNKEANP